MERKAACLLTLSLLHTFTNVVGVSSNKTITSYDPAELLSKIFKSNITGESRQRGYGFVKFDDQDSGIDADNPSPGQYGLIDPERDQRPLRFDDDYNGQNNPNDNYDKFENGNRPLKFQDSETDPGLAFDNGGVTFQDDNKVDDQGKKKRKRRRRRKPKNGVLPHYPGDGGLGRPGFPGSTLGGYGVQTYGNQGYPGTQPFRRPRRPRPRPSIAAEALSSVTDALTSIARYDDYQCVPRLLCEAAGGGALADNGVLQSIAGIQPLLTLLSAYNGVSTSPLFVFGRAVFLGMTAKGNTGTCRYAYPQCPTDPEQLIHYLNNHNGGFFRFFSTPQLPNQNLEQFYNQLGQGYGTYPPSPGQQNYGYPNDPNSGQNYGINTINPSNHNQGYGVYNSFGNHGLQRPYDRPSLYSNQNYRSNYANDYNKYGSGNQIRFKDDDKIENRIQNKPTQNLGYDSLEDDDGKTKWQFPDDASQNVNTNYYNIRDSRTLKFPETGQSHNSQKDSNRNDKHLYFPDNQNNPNYHNNKQHSFTNNNRYQTTTYSYNNDLNNQNYYNNRPNNLYNKYQATKYHNYDYNPNHSNDNNNYQNNQNYYNNRQNIYNNNNKYPTTTFNNEDYVFDYKHNFYVKKEKNYVNNNNKYNNNYKRTEDDGLKTVYVVRGNGDPNKPEIVKLRPGQSVY